MQALERPERTRTFLKAVIEYNHRAVQIDCTVKNISPTGARVDLSEVIGLPNKFDLRIPHRSESYRCELVWRDRDAIGVRFNEGKARGRKRAEGEPLDELQLENQRLKLRIRDLTHRLEALGQDPLVEERV